MATDRGDGGTSVWVEKGNLWVVPTAASLPTAATEADAADFARESDDGNRVALCHACGERKRVRLLICEACRRRHRV